MGQLDVASDSIEEKATKEAVDLLLELEMPASRSEDEAPAVSERVLLAFLHDAMPPEEMEAVATLIATYRSWGTAYWDLCAREYVESGDEVGPDLECGEL